MKKMFISMLAMAAMVSCSSENDVIDEVNPVDGKVEIKMTAGMIDVMTKVQITTPTPIETFTSATVPLLRLNATDASSLDWTSGIAANATINGNTVTLDDTHKYYDGGNNAYFIGYHTNATANKNGATIAITGVNGTKDIICTDVVNAGSKTSATTSTNLEFKHMLSQVEIQVTGTAASKLAFGNITKIELLDIPTSVDLGLTDATTTVAANGTPATSNIVIYEDGTGTGTEIPASATKIGEIPMIFNGGATAPYGTATNALNIKVYTKNNTTGLEVAVTSITGGLELGKKHVITLTFKDQISVTSSINSWTNSSNDGTGEVG